MNDERDEGGFLHYMLFIVPLAAGIGIGALANKAVEVPEVADRFWKGAALSPATAPSPAAVNLFCIVGTVAVWMLAALVIRRGGAFVTALRREAWAFAPALSILFLAILDNYGLVPDILIFASHAVVFSAATFFSITIVAAIRQGGSLAARPSVREPKGGGRGPVVAVALAAGVYWVAFSVMGSLQYYSLNVIYTDTGDFEQMLYNTIHGRFLMSTAFPHMFFGEHVEFIHLLLLPLWLVHPSLVTLMILKSAALASGAFPVYLVARRRLGSKAAAACFAVAYLLYPAMQYTDLELVQNTFRPEVLAIPALLWAVYFLEAGNMLGLVIAAFLALASKEEMALPVAMIGVLLVLRRKWAWGAGFFAVGAAWFLVSLVWVIPYFRGGPSHMPNYYRDFGENPTFAGIALQVVSHPLHALGVIFRPMKIDYLLLLFVPLGLKPLLSWRMMLVLFPSLLTALLASREPSFTIYYHYQAVLVPFLAMGAVYGTEAWTRVAAASGLILQEAAEEARRPLIVIGVAIMVLLSSLFGNVLYAKSPLSLLFYNRHMQTYWRYLYLPTDHTRLFWREVRPLVPEEASVSATEFTASTFARRKDIFVFPLGVGQADFVVIDMKDRWLEKTLAEKGTTLEKVLSEPGYARIYEKDGFYVYKKASGQEPPGGA